MSHDATVNAAEIARLGAVGRAAVSNWRRRHGDFPRPVGGTVSSPLYSLSEVEEWLRRNGKSAEISHADRAWQHLRASGTDLHLGELVARAGTYLLRLQAIPVPDQLPESVTRPLDTETHRLLSGLAADRSFAGAFEYLCDRYLEAHARRVPATPDDVAALMARLAAPRGSTVFDPACSTGSLLLHARPARALGQEPDTTTAAIATIRLLLNGITTDVRTSDALRDDTFPDMRADAVLCAPPFSERAWGQEQLTADPRWEYGLPPRSEPELAWAQHCLAHVKPGGMVAILMPQAATSRRSGRRIRSNLLRSGVLKAVISLPRYHDLWLLRGHRREDGSPTHVLLAEAGDDLSIVDAVWERFRSAPESSGAVPVIDLIDDDVDLTPARHVHDDRQIGTEYTETLRRFQTAAPQVPDLVAPDERRKLPVTTIGELIKAGVLTVQQTPSKMQLEEGSIAVLTAEDLAGDGKPSARTHSGSNVVTAEPGDIVAAPTGATQVVTSPVVAGPGLTVYRVDPDQLDPGYLAGVLRSAAYRPLPAGRADARRTQVPRLPLAEQRSYAEAFRQLTELQATIRTATDLGDALVRLGFAGLLDGHLQPDDAPGWPGLLDHE